MLSFTHGDMFDLDVDIRVNTVNCVGIMGKGVALAFKNRYPEMYSCYKEACDRGRIVPGYLHIWKNNETTVINFPTKRHWRNKSRYEDIELGLIALRSYLEPLGEVKVALPALGCGHGGLDWTIVSKMIEQYLSDLVASIYIFEPNDSRSITLVGLNSTKKIPQKTLNKYNFSDIQTKYIGNFKKFKYSSSAGNKKILDRKVKCLILADYKEERSAQAFSAIIDALAKNDNGAVISIIYRSKYDDDAIKYILKKNLKLLVFVPFGLLDYGGGVLERFSNENSVLFISMFPSIEKWSENNVSLLIEEFLYSGAKIISTDIKPIWLEDFKLKGIGLDMIYTIKYNGTEEYLNYIGLSDYVGLIGRNSLTGSPNINFLYKNNKPIVSRVNVDFSDLKRIIHILENNGLENEFEFSIKIKNNPELYMDFLNNILRK
ncbi:TPA: macro domain-containing protein [Yersinia enterocolitica]